MITPRRRVLVSAWLGFALAALVLYPLAVALDSDIFFMQWQRRDTVETAAALALLSLVFGSAVFWLWPRQGRAASVLLTLVAALPLASFLAGFVRQLPFEDALIAAGEMPVLRVLVPALLLASVVFLLARQPERFARWLRRGLLAISFVAIVVVEALVAAASYDPPPVRVDREPPAGEARPGCASVVALLFDELSFAYLHDGDTIRDEYPALQRLSATATNYLRVRAPADETLTAIPAYLAGRHVARMQVIGLQLSELATDGRATPFDATPDDGLFATARRLGYRTEMAGYYLPYCALLGPFVDSCESLSFYNASAVSDRFSPLNPIRTALIMWPRQLPFGVVKNRPFAALQRRLVDRLAAFARRPLGDAATFRFVHFSVPHLPFVFDEEGYAPPFNPLRTSPDDAYRRQLRYVDRLVDGIVGGMMRAGTFDRTTLVVLADHGFRFGGRERDALHIPFIVKRAGQTSRVNIVDAQRGEQLLRDIVSGSCDASGL
jgi:hypothetical protein